MKTTRLIAVLVVLATIAIITADASAMYHPTMGRFMSRDPGAGGAARVGASGPAVGGGFIPRDPTGTNQYADGMNLYIYARCSPLTLRDPTGLYAGITVHRAEKKKTEDSKDVGHEWIEINYKGTLISYGLWPTGSIWGSPGKVMSPDPYEGNRTGRSWSTSKRDSYRGIVLFWTRTDRHMYYPEYGFGMFGRFIRWRSVGCCKDKKEVDVIKCIKAWAFWTNGESYSIQNYNCRHFVQSALSSCCLDRGE